MVNSFLYTTLVVYFRFISIFEKIEYDKCCFTINLYESYIILFTLLVGYAPFQHDDDLIMPDKSKDNSLVFKVNEYKS